MTYSDKLRDPRWQQKRLRVFDKQDWTCQICFRKDKELHLHHNSYKRGKEPWDYPDSNFKTVCHCCHNKIHNKDAQEQPKQPLSQERITALFAEMRRKIDEACQ